MPASEGTTVIGKSVQVLGDVVGSEDVFVDGELHGSIRLSGARLTVGHSGKVRGDVGARDVIMLGRLEGDVYATGRVELRASSAVLGNIYASSFSIEEEASFRGQIDPSRAQEPMPERAAVAAAPAPAPVIPGRTTPLPAMLAAVAARTPQEPAEPEHNASLFHETEA